MEPVVAIHSHSVRKTKLRNMSNKHCPHFWRHSCLFRHLVGAPVDSVENLVARILLLHQTRSMQHREYTRGCISLSFIDVNCAATPLDFTLNISFKSFTNLHGIVNLMILLHIFFFSLLKLQPGCFYDTLSGLLRP